MPIAEEATVQVPLMETPMCRLLVVDDDELVRKHVASLLSDAGYDVRMAANGEEALRVMDKELCPIVVTDWQMADMDGIALCRNLRARQGEGYIYVMLLTVRNNRRDIVAGLGAGADDFVAKGASSEEFLARVDTGRRIIQLEQSLRHMSRENRRLAVTDPLTGARNRRYLMKYLPREYDRCQRYGHPLSLLICDIDHFKKVNDTYGHDAGDEVLQTFVTRVSGVLRKSCDWVARSGGEEFVIVLPETRISDAVTVADKIRQAVSSATIATDAGPLMVTVSVGVSGIEPAEALEISSRELLRAADRALYVSKEGGRDRTTAESVLTGAPS